MHSSKAGRVRKKSDVLIFASNFQNRSVIIFPEWGNNQKSMLIYQLYLFSGHFKRENVQNRQNHTVK